METALPWERPLWSGCPAFSLRRRERYILTDFRLVRIVGGGIDELLLRDISDIHRIESNRLIGLSTLIVHPRHPRRQPIVLRRVRRGAQLAALIEWLSGERGEHAPVRNARAISAAIAWSPPEAPRPVKRALAGVAAAVIAVFGIVIGLHGTSVPPASYPPDDRISPNGVKRPRAEIVRFMEDEIMPWARTTLGPLKGGSQRITCETCHARNPEARDWRMPAVAALPRPELRAAGWEHYGGAMDAQIRNAIYGYAAESDKQAKAAYMREFVVPGIARLLHRPAYDFTRPYAFNRSRQAIGCYHCHMVK
ncbi:MAG: hypothetical protein ABI868_12140 [Acidobacteriota bacterium]